MNREQAKKLKDVIAAFAEGKSVEYHDGIRWCAAECMGNPAIQWRVVDPANKWRDAQAAGQPVEMHSLVRTSRPWEPVPDFCNFNDSYEYRIRHKWQDVIDAVAAGKTIESRLTDYKGKPGNWYRVEVPANYVYNWDEPDVEFRVFDGLRQWKDALASGKKVQYRINPIGAWLPVGLPFSWMDCYEYRMEPTHRPFKADEVGLGWFAVASKHPDACHQGRRGIVSTVFPADGSTDISISGVGGFSFAKFLEYFELCDAFGKDRRPAGVLEDAEAS